MFFFGFSLCFLLLANDFYLIYVLKIFSGTRRATVAGDGHNRPKRCALDMFFSYRVTCICCICSNTTSLHVTRCFVQHSSFIHHHLALIDDSTMTTLHVTGKLWVCSFGCEPTHPLVCNCETGWVFFILIVSSTNDDDDEEPCRLIEY